MKRITASEARRNWFRLLDEVAAGAQVVIERAGRRIVIRRESEVDPGVPDYRSVIRSADVTRADEWAWEWSAEEAELTLREPDPTEGE